MEDLGGFWISGGDGFLGWGRIYTRKRKLCFNVFMYSSLQSSNLVIKQLQRIEIDGRASCDRFVRELNITN
jgi:hypothetical protein